MIRFMINLANIQEMSNEELIDIYDCTLRNYASENEQVVIDQFEGM